MILLALSLLLAPAPATPAFDVRIAAGQKLLSSDEFGGADDHWSAGVQATWFRTPGAGIAFDAFATDSGKRRVYEEDSVAGVVTGEVDSRWQGRTHELAVGPRLLLDGGPLRTRIGFGVSGVHAERRVIDSEGERWFHQSVGPGLWAEAGLSTRLGRSADLGISLRASASRLRWETLDHGFAEGAEKEFSAGGVQFALTLGWLGR